MREKKGMNSLVRQKEEFFLTEVFFQHKFIFRENFDLKKIEISSLLF